MDPNQIELSTLNKSFQYEKLARDIDTCNDIEELRNLAKCWFKLYLKQQEVLKSLPTPPDLQTEI